MPRRRTFSAVDDLYNAASGHSATAPKLRRQAGYRAMSDNIPERIVKLVDELDRMVPKDGALVTFEEVFKPIGHLITANQTGLLRLGIECLRAGLCPEDQTSDAQSRLRQLEHLAYLAGGDFDTVAGLRRDDQLRYKSAPPAPTLEDQAREWKKVGWIAPAFLVCFFICATVGAVSIVKWMLSFVW
jgi:hypothetical protein